jgi:predicted ArsR family transcriptional regulator
MSADREFLTVAQAAQRLGLSPARVRQLLRKRRLEGCLLSQGSREVWHVHKSLHRRPGRPGRPKKKARRQAFHGCGGEAAA